MTDLERRWEARLAGEGLGKLDYPDGAGGILVSNRGSGRPKDASAGANRPASAAEMARRAAVAGATFRRPLVKHVARLYAQGVGYQAIARRLGCTQHAARKAVAHIQRRVKVVTTLTKVPIAPLIQLSDNETLAALLGAIWRTRSTR